MKMPETMNGDPYGPVNRLALRAATVINKEAAVVKASPRHSENATLHKTPWPSVPADSKINRTCKAVILF